MNRQSRSYERNFGAIDIDGQTAREKCVRQRTAEESDSVTQSFVEFNAAFTKGFSTKPRELNV